MRIIIAGAGELGRLLASTLSNAAHDVTIIDSDADMLEHINDNLDIKVVEGSCISINTLKDAGIKTADALLAVSGDEAANILCCQLASKMGVLKTVCRLSSPDRFSEDDGVTPDKFGIWKCVSPSEECVGKIRSVLRNRMLVEKIRFSNPDAVMEVFRVSPSSLLAGTRVKDIPTDSGLLNSVRFAAIVRQKQFLIPHGDTIFVPGDKVYMQAATRMSAISSRGSRRRHLPSKHRGSSLPAPPLRGVSLLRRFARTVMMSALSKKTSRKVKNCLTRFLPEFWSSTATRPTKKCWKRRESVTVKVSSAPLRMMRTIF